jgi:RecB family exonuclease
VLRLEPLDDPGDEVEHTRRGAAVHRALARFHAPGAAGGDLPKHVLDAVEEYAARASGPVTKALWRLEGRRLLRSVTRYSGHWDAFREPWREKGAVPTPHAVEAGFGVPVQDGMVVSGPLVIEVGGVEVRIGGVIDRVDTAELVGGIGFWVIDYKTGRSQYFTAAAIERLERLQLPLYAVAVERVLFAGRPARPLGLAYWMVTDTGPKPVLPGRKSDLVSWLADADRWEAFRAQLETWVATLATHIRAGDFPLAPRSDDCTDTCHFGPTCRIAQARPVGKTWSLALPVVPGPRQVEP